MADGSNLTIWQMLEQAANSLAPPFHTSEILSWFRRHYPEVNVPSIRSHIQSATANVSAESRGAMVSRTPLLERIDRGLYVPYAAGTQTNTTKILNPVPHTFPPKTAPPNSAPVSPSSTPVATSETRGELAQLLHRALTSLAGERPVFHSEADFQHALAWRTHQLNAELQVRLETRPTRRVHLDMLLTDTTSNARLAVELKYLTAAWTGQVDNEHYELAHQAAQDIRSYDVIKDIQRVEQFTAQKRDTCGVVIVLTNHSYYWRTPRHARSTNAAAFRIHEGNVISGLRTWGPNTGTGTLKGRAEELLLQGTYRCHWHQYAKLDNSRTGTFKYMWLDIPPPTGTGTCRPNTAL